MWALCDFTEANGATRLVPGSHRWEPDRRPDARTRRSPPRCRPARCCSTAAACGTAAAPTGTDRPRLGVILEFVASWLRPQETQLARRAARGRAPTLPERLQELLGYNIYPPFLGYVDGRHPRRALDPSHDRADDVLRTVAEPPVHAPAAPSGATDGARRRAGVLTEPLSPDQPGRSGPRRVAVERGVQDGDGPPGQDHAVALDAHPDGAAAGRTPARRRTSTRRCGPPATGR